MIAVCPVCKKESTTNRAWQVYCSNKCAKEFYLQECRTETDAPLSHRSNFGAAVELLISSDLLFRGFEVFRALSPTCSCDLIAMKDHNIVRIEVRSAKEAKSGSINFATQRLSKDRSDIIAIVIRNRNNRIHYFSTENREELHDF